MWILKLRLPANFKLHLNTKFIDTPKPCRCSPETEGVNLNNGFIFLKAAQLLSNYIDVSYSLTEHLAPLAISPLIDLDVLCGFTT